MNRLRKKSKGKSKNSAKAVKREVYSKTILPQETRKTLNRQPNFTPKTTGKRKTNKKKSAEGKKSQRSEQKQMKKK